MKFVDEVTVYVRSGDGGKGCVSFRREKFVPKGGPDGGDGGKGGDVVFIADRNLSSLLDFKYKQHLIAKRGEHGRGKKCHGRNAPDLVVKVPVGTLLRDADTGDVIGDLVGDGDRLVVARGGRGGRGNARFVSSTNQAPRYAEPGEAGEEKRLRLELKLLADVGIIGLPNAGKSTLISRISAAHPRIAPYPFTTLIPNLGVVQLEDYRRFVVADIPGVIEDAHKGVGLGIRFLKHIERSKILLHVIDVSRSDPIHDYDTVISELGSFNPELLEKTQIIALNKVDTIKGDRERLKTIEGEFKAKGLEVYPVSAITGEGIEGLIQGIVRDLYKREDNLS